MVTSFDARVLAMAGARGFVLYADTSTLRRSSDRAAMTFEAARDVAAEYGFERLDLSLLLSRATFHRGHPHWPPRATPRARA